jgi:hypothetical protein
MEDKMSKTCDGCKNKVYTEDEKMLTVPYVAHQSAAARQERQMRRMWIVILLLICALIGTNLAWIIYESQFETITYEQDGAGINNVNYGEQGDLNNGAESQNQAQTQEQC